MVYVDYLMDYRVWLILICDAYNKLFPYSTLFLGMAYTALTCFVTQGKEPWTFSNTVEDYQKTGAGKDHKVIDYPKPDNKVGSLHYKSHHTPYSIYHISYTIHHTDLLRPSNESFTLRNKSRGRPARAPAGPCELSERHCGLL